MSIVSSLLSPAAGSSSPVIGSQVGFASTSTSALITGTTIMPYDDTIPQSNEGVEVLTLAYTPASATNKLRIQAVIQASFSLNIYEVAIALFKDSIADALCVNWSTTYVSECIHLDYTMVAGSTSAATFKIRVGAQGAGTVNINGTYNSIRRYGGVAGSSLTITEIQV